MINKTRQSGVTLPEMMTAVAITLIMLAASGMIFSSASKSSGKAMALNDIMKEARVITAQLESDFAGYRDDLPITLLFEGYNFNVDSNLDGIAESNYLERRDRISFFTNGDFQDMYGTNRTLMARILYSQTGNSGTNQNTDGTNEFIGTAPRQRALCRQMKMLTTSSSSSNGFIVPVSPSDRSYKSIDHHAFTAGSWLRYDLEQLEYGPENIWKNADTNSFSNNWWLTEDNSIVSFIRRPNYDSVYNAALTVNGGNTFDARRTMSQYKQNNTVVLDCTNFTIQAWLIPPGEYAYRWFPTNWDLDNISLQQSGSYWNGLGMTSGVPFLGICWNMASGYIGPFPIDAAGQKGLWPNYLFPDPTHMFAVPLAKPKAFKFTFKLHDENRSHFPEGKMFSYIIDVRDKD